MDAMQPVENADPSALTDTTIADTTIADTTIADTELAPGLSEAEIERRAVTLLHVAEEELAALDARRRQRQDALAAAEETLAQTHRVRDDLARELAGLPQRLEAARVAAALVYDQPDAAAKRAEVATLIERDIAVRAQLDASAQDVEDRTAALVLQREQAHAADIQDEAARRAVELRVTAIREQVQTAHLAAGQQELAAYQAAEEALRTEVADREAALAAARDALDRLRGTLRTRLAGYPEMLTSLEAQTALRAADGPTASERVLDAFVTFADMLLRAAGDPEWDRPFRPRPMHNTADVVAGACDIPAKALSNSLRALDRYYVPDPAMSTIGLARGHAAQLLAQIRAVRARGEGA